MNPTTATTTGLQALPALALAVHALGVAAPRLGGRWCWRLPAGLVGAAVLGGAALRALPVDSPLPAWAALAALWMTAVLVALPRPHSSPSAWTATALLGLALGHQMAVLAARGPAAPVAFAAAAVLLHAGGAWLGRRTTARPDAERRFVRIGALGAALGLVAAAALAR